jgi:hypothetical protein
MSTLFARALQTYVAGLETIWLRSVHLIPVWGMTSPWQRQESRGLLREKGEAWLESQLQIALAPYTFAMRVQAELWRAATTLPLRHPLTVLPSRLPQILGRASEGVVIKALDPYRTRTMKNAKRLKQRSLSNKR